MLRRALAVLAFILASTSASAATVSFNDPGQDKVRSTLWARHEGAARELLSQQGAEAYLEDLGAGFDEIAHFGQVASTMHHAPEFIREIVSGYGEPWSAQLLAAYLRASKMDARWVNAREILVVRDLETDPEPVWGESKRRLDSKSSIVNIVMPRARRP